MSMKSTGILLALALMGSSTANTQRYVDDIEPPTDEEKENARIERLKAKGMKEFYINGKTIWALNEKSAIRKSKKS